MAHMWHKGVLTTSSWHGLEEVGALPDGQAMIAKGEACGAWPVAIDREGLQTAGGLPASVDGIVATYADAHRAVVGAVGTRYRATDPAEWRGLVAAAADAGARPTGAFALRGGAVVLATFEVGTSNGLRTNFILGDSFDGSTRLMAGESTVRVVCANTLAAAMRQDGEAFSRILHTASAETKINILRESIGKAITAGEAIRRLYETAEATYLTHAGARKAFDAMFPSSEAPKGRAATLAENARCDARRVAGLDINRVGEGHGNLATLWNAATYLVDREADGSARTVRGGGDMLDSLLLGARAKRVEEIRKVVEVVLRDGSIQRMTASEAQSHGVDTHQIGRSILADMLGE